MDGKQLRIRYEEGGMDKGGVQEQIDSYFCDQRHYYKQMEQKEQIRMLISEMNWQTRHSLPSCRAVGIKACIGDICFIDFGKAYRYETGFQHFGLILSMYHGKVFVVPMTSNAMTYALGYHPKENPQGKRHLLRIGQVVGLAKPSVLFVNDAKFINPARILDVKAHIDENSEAFQEIRRRIKKCIGL